MRNRCFFWMSIVFFLGSTGLAGTIGGVELPDHFTVGNQNLVLNGAGLRKKLFIKVYAGGLYTTEKSKDQKELITADKVMAVRMHFIYDGVAAKKLVGAWNEGFTYTAKNGFAKEKDAFNALFTHEAEEGNTYDVVYEPGKGIEVFFNGESQGSVACDAGFKAAVFAIWLGDHPADEGLKEGMLGG